MNDNLDNFFYDPDDTDIEDLTYEEQETIKYQSMNNTYKLIINGYDFDAFSDPLFWLLTNYDQVSVFDVLIDYFQDPLREEYEKCAVLKEIRDKRLAHMKSRDAKKGKFTYKLGVQNKDL